MNSRKIIAVFDNGGRRGPRRRACREMGIPRDRISIAGRDSDKTVESENARGGVLGARARDVHAR